MLRFLKLFVLLVSFESFLPSLSEWISIHSS
nr:MAG TPA: hypothetical protein [Caudoviricetes sp.]